MQIDDISKLAQACFKECPTIILGSGASMPHGLPSMNDLRDYLQGKVVATGSEEEDAWALVHAALTNGDHLEAALEGKTLPETLLAKIIHQTWQCISEKDQLLLKLAVENGQDFPLGTLLSRLFQSSIKKVDIVTTNYDRVAEYSANSVGLLFQAGFAPGYIQKWESADGVRFMHDNKSSRVVKIWKVHGSLDWFRTSENRTVGLPAFASPDQSFNPLIVTPGLNKYQKTHEDPFRTTINGADLALKRANAFLCVGFGFRDSHIHPKIIERCLEKNVPTVVLARTLTDDAKSFLKQNAGKNYVGIEKSKTGSRVYTIDFPDGVEILDQDFWSLSGFNTLII
jgi:hypothetical protein